MKTHVTSIPAGKARNELFMNNYAVSKYALSESDMVEFQNMITTFLKGRDHIDWNVDDIAFVYEVDDNGFKEMAIHISGICSTVDIEAKKKLGDTILES